MSTPQLLPNRDLVKDEMGNYYLIQSISSDKIILVNAVVDYASRRVIDDEFYSEHKGETPINFATQMLQNQIERLASGQAKGEIYLLDSLKSRYEVVVNGLYNPSAQV